MKNPGAIILAAGKGSRIGTPKIFLKIFDEYFVNIISEKLISAGIFEICCVIAPETDVPKHSFNHQIKWSRNPQSENGMISSIYWGVQFLKNCDGYLIVPVDHPSFQAKTIIDLKNSFLGNRFCAHKPIFENRSGHPIIIPREVAVQIKPQDYKGGLNQFLINSNCKIKYVETNDPGILKNINTKHELEKVAL